MAIRRALAIGTIGLTTIGCLGGGALQMPSSSGGQGETGGAAGAPGPGGGRAGHAGATGVAGRAGAPAGSSGIGLTTNADGWLEANPAGAVGRWWSTGDYFAQDGAPAPGAGPCPSAGFLTAACSTLTTPTPGMPFQPDPNGRGMCTSGTAAQVVPGNDGQPAWAAIWGNIIGVDLATSDPAPVPVVGTYDAPAHGITGFAFDIDGRLPPGHLRVLVPTAENDHDAAYWEGATMDLSPFVGPGHYEIRWPQVGGPLYLGADAPPFDPTKIESIAFHVVSREFESASYDFCISKVVLLTN